MHIDTRRTCSSEPFGPFAVPGYVNGKINHGSRALFDIAFKRRIETFSGKRRYVILRSLDHTVAA